MSRNFFILLSLFILFFSCKEQTIVDITVKPMEAEATPGSSVTFYIQLKPDALNGGELGELQVLDSVYNIIFTQEFSGYTTDSTRFIYNIPTEAKINSIIKFSIVAFDAYSKLSDTVYPTITITDGVPKLISVSNLQLYFTGIDTLDTNQLVLSVNSAFADTLNNDKSILTFVWTNGTGYTLTSPDAEFLNDIYQDTSIYNPDNQMNTKLQLYEGNWDELNSHKIDSLEIITETIVGKGNGIANLHEGNIITFITQDSIKGALLIKTTAKSTNYLIFDLIFQDK
jgi:hypothetical protein